MIKILIINFLKFIKVIPKNELNDLKTAVIRAKNTAQNYWDADHEHHNSEDHMALFGQLYGLLQTIEKLEK